MNKKEKREYVMRSADAMARSGKYDSWSSIEHILRCEGFPEARQWLDDDFTRKELQALCDQARAMENA